MDRTEEFEAQRPRLVAIAGRLLQDPVEAQDVVQQAWLRLHGTDAEIDEAMRDGGPAKAAALRRLRGSGEVELVAGRTLKH